MAGCFTSYGNWNTGRVFFCYLRKVSTNLSARVRANGNKQVGGVQTSEISKIPFLLLVVPTPDNCKLPHLQHTFSLAASAMFIANSSSIFWAILPRDQPTSPRSVFFNAGVVCLRRFFRLQSDLQRIKYWLAVQGMSHFPNGNFAFADRNFFQIKTVWTLPNNM